MHSSSHSPRQNLRLLFRLRLPGFLKKGFHIRNTSYAFQNRHSPFAKISLNGSRDGSLDETISVASHSLASFYPLMIASLPLP